MKSVFYLTAVLLIAFSCKKPGDPKQAASQLTVDKTTVSLKNTINSSDSILLTSTINWTITITPAVSWLKISSTSGNGTTKILITAIEANQTSSARSATITITPVGSSSIQPISITVTQGITDKFMTADSSSIILGSLKGSIDSFTILSNINYKITGLSAGNWLSISDTIGSNQLKMYVTAIGSNITGVPRYGSIVIKSDPAGLLPTKYIPVYQPSSFSDTTWSRLIGGTKEDIIYCSTPALDGGYILAGITNSNDSDAIGNHGGEDILVVKMDESGNKLWRKVYGGSGDDAAMSIKQTLDGGYILAGSSNSSDGDFNGNFFHGVTDGLLLKIDASGSLIWSHLYGGSDFDDFWRVTPTSDGGYIAIGKSQSVDGDISGSHGSVDGWVCKVDANGNKQWSKVFGGSINEAIGTAVQTSDGGYMLSGYTNSWDGDVVNPGGTQQGWLIKLDGSGTMQWNRTYGGSSDDIIEYVLPTQDGGYIFTGVSKSNDHDVFGNHGDNDLWIGKIDVNGILQWSKLYGGSGSDDGWSIIPTADGGYIIGGNCGSNDGDITGFHGGFNDIWILKVDANGQKLWSKTYGGPGNEFLFSLIAVNNSLIFGGETTSNGSDFNGYIGGGGDGFIIKIKMPN